MHIKGALDKYYIIPNFFQQENNKNLKKIKRGDFDTIKSVGLGLWLHAEFHVLEFNLFFEEIWIFLAFSIFKVNFNTKYLIKQPMGHSEDDAIHKIPHKNENALAESAEKFVCWI